MKINLADNTLFGNDAGEDEAPDVLASYFLNKELFSDFFSRDNRLCFARSRKGMGKSALLSKLDYDLKNDPEKPIVIRTTGSQLLGIAHPDRTDHLALQNYWIRVLCARVNLELGKQIGFAFRDNTMTLVEQSELAGFKERNIVGALLSRISSSKIPINFSTPAGGQSDQILANYVSQNPTKMVWLLIDDIDSTYVNDPISQAKVSTFFSACRAIVRDIGGLHIRATIRTDVWTNFTANEDLDKSEQYMIDIHWSAKELKSMLARKIYAYISRNEDPSALINIENEGKYLERAFTRRMRWGSSSVEPFRPIHILSSGRPRWMSQLCRLSGKQAQAQNRDLIGISEINTIQASYGRYRLDDIYKEHSHQFNDLKRLIETFSNRQARYSTTELLSNLIQGYCRPTGTDNIPDIDGARYQAPMQLAHFLFKIGFIAARKEHAGNTDLADFVKHQERSELLTDIRNPDDGYQWEVYPSYRAVLKIKSAGQMRKSNLANRALGGRGRNRSPRG